MTISGTVPTFDVSTTPDTTGKAVVVVVSGQASGPLSTECLPVFYRRALGILTMSGVLDTTSGTTSGMQCVSGAVLTGLHNLQQELALRIVDVETSNAGNAPQLAKANAILVASGEVQLGS
jgi:hypothetical protein